MRTLCIMNYKGGVGKTTTAVNIAYSLGEIGNKILLVDADQQGNSTYIATRRAYTGKTLRDVMQGAGIRSAKKEPSTPVNTGQSGDSGRQQEPVREKAESEPVNTGVPPSFMPDRMGPKEEPEKRTVFDFLKEGSRNQIASWMNETFVCPPNAECLTDPQMEEEAKKGRCRVCWHEFLRREFA